MLNSGEGNTRSWKDISKLVLEELYNAVNKEAPEWINELMPKSQLEENIDNYIDSVRAFLNDTINETHVKYFKDKDDRKGYKLTPEMRINNCIDYKLIPFIDSINGDGNTIIIYSSVLPRVLSNSSRYGITSGDISGLQELANILGLQYGRKKINGRQVRVIYGEKSKLFEFLQAHVTE